jgi:hypothetical protein
MFCFLLRHADLRLRQADVEPVPGTAKPGYSITVDGHLFVYTLVYMHYPALPPTKFWLLATVIIGVDFAVTLLLLFGVRRTLLNLEKTRTSVRNVVSIFGVVLFGWFATALFLTWNGVFRATPNQSLPYIALAIGIPILVGALLIRGSKEVREIVAAVPQAWLVAIQFSRVVGGTFLIVYSTGQLPGIFALPAGVGDILVGLTALLVAVRCAREPSDQFVRLWNWFGIGDLVVAIAAGFLSAPSRFQIFALDAPNFLIGSFPLAMIPAYAVPLFIVLHMASLSKVRNPHRTVAKEMASA